MKKGWSTLQSWYDGFRENATGYVSTALKKGWNTFQSWFNGLRESASANVNAALKKGWAGNVQSWFNGLKESASATITATLSKGWSTVKSWFENLPSADRSGTSFSGVKINLYAAWETITSWFSGLDKKFKNPASIGGIKVGLYRGWDSIKGWFQGLDKKFRTAISISAIKVNLKKGWNSLQQWFNKVTTGKTNKTPTVNMNASVKGNGRVNARGGAYYSGHWHDIAQYATGGIPSQGTMFVAGEAGAEVVGDINGRTEVLNQSQLASAIHSAVLSAMQQANASGQSPVFNITVRTENNEVLARAVTRGQKSLDARLNPTAQYA